MLLTPEQEQIGRDNFHEAAGYSLKRRDLLKAAAAGGVGLGTMYFGYGAVAKSDRIKTAFIGCGDEANVLMTEHPEDYMEIVAIADPRQANIKRSFEGSGIAARIGLNKKLGAAASSIKQYAHHRDLLEARKKGEVSFDAVVIAVPLNQHAPIALECLDEGLHVDGLEETLCLFGWHQRFGGCAKIGEIGRRAKIGEINDCAPSMKFDDG